MNKIKKGMKWIDSSILPVEDGEYVVIYDIGYNKSPVCVSDFVLSPFIHNKDELISKILNNTKSKPTHYMKINLPPHGDWVDCYFLPEVDGMYAILRETMFNEKYIGITFYSKETLIYHLQRGPVLSKITHYMKIESPNDIHVRESYLK